MTDSNSKETQDSHDSIDKFERQATALIKTLRDELTGVVDQLGDDVSRNIKKIEQKPLIAFGTIFLGGCMAGLFLGRNHGKLASHKPRASIKAA